MYKSFGDGIITNVTETNEYLIKIGENYDVDYISKTGKDSYSLSMFGGVIVGYPKNVWDRLQKFQELKQSGIDSGDILKDLYIKNGELWFKLYDGDKYIYDTNIKGYVKMTETRKKFEEAVNKRGHKMMSRYFGSRQDILIDYQCGHDPVASNPNTYLSQNRGCPICSKKLVVEGINDCNTLRPDLLKYFANPKDAIGVGVSNRVRRFFVCPNCGTRKEDTIANIATFGFHCSVCKNNISYPEKFMANVLKELNVEFQPHVYFDWCKFDFRGKERRGIYDFLIKSKKLIIETDGGQHYIYDGGSDITVEEQHYIDDQKTKLAIENGYNIVRVNCYYNHTYKRIEHMKENIATSLSMYFDFDNIDWLKVDSLSIESDLARACELWNEGKSTKEISELLNINKASIYDYIKIGTAHNMCNFTPSEGKARGHKNLKAKSNRYTKAVKKGSGELVGAFWDIDIFVDKLLKETGVYIKRAKILSILKGNSRNQSIKGISFVEITKDEYDILVQSKGIITDT